MSHQIIGAACTSKGSMPPFPPQEVCSSSGRVFFSELKLSRSCRPPCAPFSSCKRARLRPAGSHWRSRCRKSSVVLRCQTGRASDVVNEEGSNGHKRILVLGGTGRVGSSTAVALLRKDPSLQVIVASRSRASYYAAVKKRPKLAAAKFEKVDIDDLHSVTAALEGAALVVHTAGPFQRKENNVVLEAAIATKTPYVDVCDDADYSQLMKGYGEQAKAAGVPAITSAAHFQRFVIDSGSCSAGIYPGVSNLMAAHMISIARREYDADWRLTTRRGEPDSQHDASSASLPQPLRGDAVEPTRVRYSYYTAGSGGVGATILETSFLLAGTDVVVYRNGEKVMLEPITEKRVVDFGRGLGEKPVWLYNLPEVFSTHKYLHVPSVSARFGTDPPFWNWAMLAVARLAPKDFLSNRSKIKWFARLSMPWVQVVDPFAGEKVGMLVEVDLADNTTAAGLYTHKYLNESVGTCVAAFARAMLNGSTEPGVWFPEEPEAVSDRRGLLMDAAEGTITFDLNKPPWQLGTDPKQIGMGMYF